MSGRKEKGDFRDKHNAEEEEEKGSSNRPDRNIPWNVGNNETERRAKIDEILCNESTIEDISLVDDSPQASEAVHKSSHPNWTVRLPGLYIREELGNKGSEKTRRSSQAKGYQNSKKGEDNRGDVAYAQDNDIEAVEKVASSTGEANSHPEAEKPSSRNRALPVKNKLSFQKIFDKVTCDCITIGGLLAYSLIYLMFLLGYAAVILYISLLVIKAREGDSTFDYIDGLGDESDPEQPEIKLSGVPIPKVSYPTIWYRRGVAEDYEKYIADIDEFISNKREQNVNTSVLGPCARRPYGYDLNPCIIVRPHFLSPHWRTLRLNSTRYRTAPEEVQKWVAMGEQKYWLHCIGLDDFDRANVGAIRYYPDPPGVTVDSYFPYVALQVSNFTLGVSIVIECTLWYETGVAKTEFVLNVAPNNTYA